jgi:hypothetical protein
MNYADYQAQREAIAKRQQIAQAIMQAGTSGGPGGQMVSGRYVAPSALASLAPILQTAFGAYGDNKATADLGALDKSHNDEIASALGAYSNADESGRPAALQTLTNDTMAPADQAKMQVAQAMTPRSPVQVAPGASLYDPVSRKSVFTAPEKAEKPDKDFVEYKDAGDKLLPVSHLSGKPVPDLKPIPKTLTPNQASTQGANDALDPETMDLVAQDYLKTGKLPPLYRDNQTKMKIMNRAAQLAKANGDDASAAIIGRQTFGANRASLNKVSAQKNMVGAFEKTFQKNLDLALSMSDKVDRTGSPLINKALISWKTGVAGDPETKGYINALTTARDEYAKILSGATGAAGITDAGRKEAEELFSKIDSPETLKYVAEVARQETGNRMTSFDEQINELTGAMGNAKPDASPNKPQTAAPQAPTEAITHLKAHPELKDAFKAKYGYLPDGI